MIRFDTLGLIAALIFLVAMFFNAWATINTP